VAFSPSGAKSFDAREAAKGAKRFRWRRRRTSPRIRGKLWAWISFASLRLNADSFALSRLCVRKIQPSPSQTAAQ